MSVDESWWLTLAAHPSACELCRCEFPEGAAIVVRPDGEWLVCRMCFSTRITGATWHVSGHWLKHADGPGGRS